MWYKLCMLEPLADRRHSLSISSSTKSLISLIEEIPNPDSKDRDLIEIRQHTTRKEIRESQSKKYESMYAIRRKTYRWVWLYWITEPCTTQTRVTLETTMPVHIMQRRASHVRDHDNVHTQCTSLQTHTLAPTHEVTVRTLSFRWVFLLALLLVRRHFFFKKSIGHHYATLLLNGFRGFW